MYSPVQKGYPLVGIALIVVTESEGINQVEHERPLHTEVFVCQSNSRKRLLGAGAADRCNVLHLRPVVSAIMREVDVAVFSSLAGGVGGELAQLLDRKSVV